MNKMQRFAEMKRFGNCFEPIFSEVFHNDHELKGKWNTEVFKNNNPIVLELGCGKGEYTIGLGEKYPDKNFIGIDIKGARIWIGAKKALQNNMQNVVFLRTRIEVIKSFFAHGEISEIWITFPDPQPKKPAKRLTSSEFLNRYKKFLQPEAVIHLKTDSIELHEYTLELIHYNKLDIIEATNDLYNSGVGDDVLSIKTYYESQFLEEGKKITYLKFSLPNSEDLSEPGV